MRFEPALESQLRQMLTQTLVDLNLILAEDAQAKIIEYLVLLDHWNKRYNLTAIRDPKEMMVKHIADSLAVAPYLEVHHPTKAWGNIKNDAGCRPQPTPCHPEREARDLVPHSRDPSLHARDDTGNSNGDEFKLASLEGVRIIDVGTGAGLPGIPLSFVFPDWQWTLLDSNGKKTRFLIHVKSQLKLENVEIVQSRIEDFRDRNCFNGVITRAWTQLEVMLVKTRHLYCDSGKLWALKGAYPTEELKNLHGAFTVYPLKVPGLFERRHLVCVSL